MPFAARVRSGGSWAAMLAISMVLLVGAGRAAAQSPAPEIAARAWLLVDVTTHTVLYSQLPDERVEPASLTKLMTAYLVFNALKEKRLSLDARPPVSQAAYKAIGSRMFIDPRTPATVDELLHGLIIQSGNDAAIVLAETIGGSEAQFAEIMNAEGKRIGMTNSRFTNASGLPDPNHYSTAKDLATLAVRLIEDHPDYYRLYSQKEYTYNKIRQPNRNRLLFTDPTVDGVKTGHTDQAGYNLVASAVDGNTRFVTVVMGVPTIKGREVETKKLLQWGFNNFETLKPLNAGTVVSEQTVYYGKENKVKLGTIEDGYITIPKGKMNDLKARYELTKKYLEAPLQKGDVVGQVIYQLDGKDVAKINLQVLEPVEEASFFGKIIDWIILTVKSLFS